MSAKFQINAKGYPEEQFRTYDAQGCRVPVTFESEAAATEAKEAHFGRRDKDWEVGPYIGDRYWRDRECQRFNAKIYLRAPWYDEPWYRRKIRNLPHSDHYLHISVNDLTKVAFTENDKKGMFDRQTVMLPGRYLKKFYGDVLSEPEIAEWSAKFGAYFAEPELLFAATPDEIEHVYTHGPHSCMSGAAGNFPQGIHATRVYGAGDLAVAYIKRLERITARTVCWPEKKVYTRVYGDSARLVPLLEKAGFKASYTGNDRAKNGDNYKLYGARCLLIPLKDSRYPVMPYLDDGFFKPSDDGKHLIITDSDEGAWRGDVPDVDDEEEAEPEYEYTCDCCGDGCNGGATVYIRQQVRERFWCESCVDNYATRCACCEELRESDYVYSVYTRPHIETYYCQECIADTCNEVVEIDDIYYLMRVVEANPELKAKYDEQNAKATA